MAKTYLAGGCFWGLEITSQKCGVTATTVGYGGKTLNTNYQKSKHPIMQKQCTLHCSLYDICVTTLGCSPLGEQAGNDVGERYRTGIITNDADLLVIDYDMSEQKSLLIEKLAVEG